MPYLGKQPARTPIDASDIPDDSITAAKIVDGTIVAADIATGAVDTAELAADAVTGAKIADNAIDSEHYTDGSIDNAHIADNAIDSEHYADGSIDNAHIADDAIDSEHYADGSIDNAHIADDAIGSEHYAAGSVDATALGADCVTAAKIGDNVLDSEHYAAASIDNEHLADNAVDTAEIADNAVTLAKMAGGTDGNIISYDASGDPVAVATGDDGQVLTSAGAGAPPVFEDAAGGGLSEVDQWRLTTDRGTSAGVTVITANLERVDTDSFEHIGTGMTESSGIFTFPSTGKWLISFHCRCNQVTGAARYVFFDIDVSTDTGSSWSYAAESAFCIPDAASGTDYANGSICHLFDVTNISTHQVRFGLTPSVYVVLDGQTASTETSFLFQKLGDT